MSLWDWSVAAYAAPGVAEACLELQDKLGHNVPLLLWAAWTALEGRPLDEDVIEAAIDTARAWSRSAIEPLRAVRRTLKTRIPDVADGPRESVRAEVKALELACERHLLEALEALSPPASKPPRPVMEGLVPVARAWETVLPRPALQRLADHLPAA